MSNFIIYNKATGNIIRTGFCPESMMELQVDNEIESAIKGTADDIYDQINLETKEIMKDFKTSRQKLQEETDLKWAEETPMREREAFIKQREEKNSRDKAVRELIDEGIIT